MFEIKILQELSIIQQLRPSWADKCLHTVNVIKFGKTLFHTFLAYILVFMHLFLKILSERANSAESDQTLLQEQSDKGLHCLHMSFIINFGL